MITHNLLAVNLGNFTFSPLQRRLSNTVDLAMILCRRQCCHCNTHTHTRTHTHPFNGPLSGTTQVSQYQKGKTNLDFTEARDSWWQWHQLGHNASLHLAPDRQPHQTSTPPLLCFLQAGCPSCRPTNSVKALKAITVTNNVNINHTRQRVDACGLVSAGLTMWQMWQMPWASGLRGASGSREIFSARQ